MDSDKIDLDDILSRAETKKEEEDESSSGNNDLMDAFSKVATIAFEEKTWDDIIPLAERIEAEEEELAKLQLETLKPRVRRNLKDKQDKESKDDDKNENDNGSDEADDDEDYEEPEEANEADANSGATKPPSNR